MMESAAEEKTNGRSEDEADSLKPLSSPSKPPPLKPTEFAERYLERFFRDSKGGAISFGPTNCEWINKYYDTHQSDTGQGNVILFKIIDVFSDNDFTMQLYDTLNVVSFMEEILHDICELRFENYIRHPMKLKLQKWYAVKHEGKWVRCALIVILEWLPDDSGPLTSIAVFRMLDYGTWIAYPFPSKLLADYNELILELPSVFMGFQPHGFIASQCLSNGIWKTRLTLDELNSLTNTVVQIWIENYKPPKKGFDHVPHLTVNIIDVYKFATQHTVAAAKRVRRKSV